MDREISPVFLPVASPVSPTNHIPSQMNTEDYKRELLFPNKGKLFSLYSYLGKISPCPSCPSFPFPQLHTSVRRDGRSASASPLYVGVRATVLILARPTFLKSLGETLVREARING